MVRFSDFDEYDGTNARVQMSAKTKERKSGRKAKIEVKAAAKASKSGALTALTADRHELYQLSVQNVEAEIDFIEQEFENIRGVPAKTLREDFCGTGNTSAEWVRRNDTNTAVGLDIDGPTLLWGEEHHVAGLTEDQQSRIRLLDRNVLEPGDAAGCDCVLAMNFSYWLFKTRDELRNYFKTVRESMAPNGVFFLDHYGGSEAMVESEETKKIDAGSGRSFTYIWDQHSFNPITNDLLCHIHFKFPDKTRMNKAFTYQWRLWSMVEIRELLSEAGFANVVVYWEDEDEDGEGNGEYEATLEGEADLAFVSYIVAYD